MEVRGMKSGSIWCCWFWTLDPAGRNRSPWEPIRSAPITPKLILHAAPNAIRTPWHRSFPEESYELQLTTCSVLNIKPTRSTYIPTYKTKFISNQLSPYINIYLIEECCQGTSLPLYRPFDSCICLVEIMHVFFI